MYFIAPNNDLYLKKFITSNLLKVYSAVLSKTKRKCFFIIVNKEFKPTKGKKRKGKKEGKGAYWCVGGAMGAAFIFCLCMMCKKAHF